MPPRMRIKDAPGDGMAGRDPRMTCAEESPTGRTTDELEVQFVVAKQVLFQSFIPYSAPSLPNGRM